MRLKGSPLRSPARKRPRLPGIWSESDIAEYADDEVQYDLAHGCIIIDIGVDIGVDVGVDVAGDLADAGADLGADDGGGGGDDGGDSGDDGGGGGGSGLDPASTAGLKFLAGVLGTTVVGYITNLVSNAITNALEGSDGTPSSEQYWTALYNEMIEPSNYPCDLPASQSCGGTPPGAVRQSQEYMVLAYANNIANANPDENTAAETFYASGWPVSAQQLLKTQLTDSSQTAGIPTMLQAIMAPYTYSGCTGGALVIATTNTLYSVMDYVFTD